MVKRIMILSLAMSLGISALCSTTSAQGIETSSGREAALESTTPSGANATLLPHIEALRATEGGIQSADIWDIARFEAAIQSLLEHDQCAVALTWLNKALAHPAHLKGRGANAAKKRLRALEKTLGVAFKARAKNEVRLALKMAKHASSAANGRNYAIAKAMLHATRRHLEVFCHPGARRTLERVEKKLANVGRIQNTNGRSVERQRKASEAMMIASKRMIDGALDDFVAAFAVAGDPERYAATRSLITRTLGDDESDRARTLSWRIRDAMIAAGYGKEVSILVTGLRDLTIEIAGKRIASQRSMCAQRKGDVVKTMVLPGDYLLVRTRGTHDAKRRNMIAFAATVGGKPLAEKDVFTTRASDTLALWRASIEQATTGEVVEIDPAEHDYPAKFTRAVQFETQVNDRLMRLNLAMDPAVLAWFGEQEAKPVFALATDAEPHFAIRIPTVIEP